jgi:ubiquinone/menaquinone biosynthesis C-methylase UbiE
MVTAEQGPNDTYTHGHHDSVLRSHRSRTVENSAAYLVPYLEPGIRLLDVGCGPGTITADFGARIAPGEVVAIEREQAVIDEATSVATEQGLTNVTVELGDVYDLAYDDDSFDVVHAHQVLQHLSDPVAALAEMRRVAKPDGVVAARDADYAGMTWYPADERLDRWMEVYQAVARSNDAEPNAARWLLAWANQVGFSAVTISASIWCYTDDATRQWWGSLWATRMTSSAVAEQAVAKGIATADELDAIADGFRDWTGHPDGYFTVPHAELLATP